MILLANVMILMGSLFIFIAALGMVRMNDIYMKMHAATKAATLGAGLVLLGVGLQAKNVHAITGILIVIFFIVLTNPISAHLIAKLAYSRESKNKNSL